MSSPQPPIDLLDPNFYVGDPHPAYRWMRRNHPVYRDEKNHLWAITKIDHLREVERRADLYPSGQGYRVNWNPGEGTMISKDDPRHLKQRKLVAERFTPRAVDGREKEIRELVAHLLDVYWSMPQVEVVETFAARLPATLTARLLGFGDAHWRNVKVWSERLMRIDMIVRDPKLLHDGVMSVREFAEVLEVLVEERRREPCDDLVSIWANSEIDGSHVDMHTIVDETGLFVSGGAETTRTTIARALITFCEHPEQWELLVEDPSRIPTAIEEIFRFVTPLNNMLRTAAEDTRIGDQKINKGDKLMLLYPAANRDEDHFEEPDRFDVLRDPNPHVAFGLGTHFCLGAALARLTLRVALEELTRRFARFRLVDAPEYEANIFVKAVQRLDLTYDRR